MEAKAKNTAVKSSMKISMKDRPKVSRRRVNELVVLRLEALARKQRLRRPVRRKYSVAASARSLAFSAHLRETLAKLEAQRKKEPLTTQVRSLVRDICQEACSRKRPSFGQEPNYAEWRRMVSARGITFPGLPPRTRETNPCLRCLDRAEARLLRLVQAWAMQEAQREVSSQETTVSCEETRQAPAASSKFPVKKSGFLVKNNDAPANQLRNCQDGC